MDGTVTYDEVVRLGRRAEVVDDHGIQWRYVPLAPGRELQYFAHRWWHYWARVRTPVDEQALSGGRDWSRRMIDAPEEGWRLGPGRDCESCAAP